MGKVLKKSGLLFLMLVVLVGLSSCGGKDDPALDYDTGYKEGYEEGYDNGFDKGYEEASEKEADTAREKGYSEGWDDCCKKYGIIENQETGEVVVSGVPEQTVSAGTETGNPVGGTVGAASGGSSSDYSYVVNKNSGVIHRATCSSVSNMNEENKLYTSESIASLTAQGYHPCQRCSPS